MSAAADVSSVAAAASWLATGSADRSKPVVPQLKERFGLTALQAVQAMREANLVKARAH